MVGSIKDFLRLSYCPKSFLQASSLKIFYRGSLEREAKRWEKKQKRLAVSVATVCNILMNGKETPGVLPMFTANARGLNPKVKQTVHS